MASPIEIKPSPGAGSPHSIAPAPQCARQQSICIKPSTSAGSPAPMTPGSVTSKEWVIPPRPKPGRKPATDTPPTKRKAQNRAAQRAFRERRAARVGELEEQMKQMEEEDEREQVAFRDHISELSLNLEQCQGQLNLWVERCNALEKELSAEKNARESVTHELKSLQRRETTSATPLATRQIQHEQHIHAEEPIGCGGCSSTTRCECIEAAIDMAAMPENDVSSAPKRPHSPQQDDSDKRVKPEPIDDEPMEMDFTNAFSKPIRALRPVEDSVPPNRIVADPCGFCQDGTPCICAEMAAAENAATEERVNSGPNSTRVPSIRQLAQFTPPPSDSDVSLPPPAPQASTPSDPCVNGAGTCAQCRADPNSTLFCKTLAAARAQSQGSSTPAGCCGGSRNGQACCQSQSQSRRSSRTLPLPARRTRSAAEAQTPSSSVALTCADAYTTLSRHPNYERAITSGDVGSWMPKLYASPSRQLEQDPSKEKVQVMNRAPARPAMEIEVANVMSVLREFDRRFGSSA